MKPDFTFSNHGSLCLLCPVNNDAKGWLDEHVGGEMRWWAGALAIEHRYVNPILEALIAEGFHIANGQGGLN